MLLWMSGICCVVKVKLKRVVVESRLSKICMIYGILDVLEIKMCIIVLLFDRKRICCRYYGEKFFISDGLMYLRVYLYIIELFCIEISFDI